MDGVGIFFGVKNDGSDRQKTKLAILARLLYAKYKKIV
jgi:hypothetical protein